MLTPTAFKILGVVVAGAGYLCKECTDAIQRKCSEIGKALDANNVASRHQQIQLGFHTQREQLQTFQNKVLSQIDYNAVVLQGIAELSQMQGLVRQESEDVSQLIDKLVLSSRFKKRRKDFEAAQAAPIKYEPTSKEALQKEMNWTDAVHIKSAILSTLTTALPIIVFSDGIIAAAKTQMKLLASLVRCGRWAVRILYVAGACLAGYGAIKGIK